jgi:hypothetical protein
MIRAGIGKMENKKFYATLEYIRHFIFAGCYDNGPWYLVTNLAGHLDLRGFYFSKNAPLILNRQHFHLVISITSPSLNIMYFPGIEHAPPLIECGSSTNEPWKLHTFLALGFM